MTECDAGYLHALSDVQSEVRKMVQDPSTSREGKLELLGVLSFLSELVDAKVKAIAPTTPLVQRTFGGIEE